MKKLASVTADIYHKHYADNAYKTTLVKEHLADTHIITYTNYSGLQSTGYFLNLNFFRKSNAPRVIIGIGGLGKDLDGAVFEKQLEKLIEFLPNHVELYVHAACHVKMLSHDDITILGSQNVSSTSLPYLSASTASSYRFHEVQVEFPDRALSCAKALFDEILCDPSMHVKLTRQSNAAEVASHLLNGFSIDGHRQKIELTQALGALLNKNVAPPAHMAFVPAPEKKHYLVDAAIALYNAPDVTRAHIDELFETLYVDGDDYPLGEAFTDHVFELSELLESASHEAIPERNRLLPILRSIHSREMTLPEGDEYEAFIEALKDCIEQHSCTDTNEFVNRHQHALLQRVMESPDYADNAVTWARDEDGGLNEYAVLEALLNGDIDPWRYMQSLSLSNFIAAIHEVMEAAYITAMTQAFTGVNEAYQKLREIYKRELGTVL